MGAEIWFGENIPWLRKYVGASRESLRQYDRNLADLLEEMFGDRPLAILHIWVIFLGFCELHRKLRRGLSYDQASTVIAGFIFYFLFIPFFWALGLGYRELYRKLHRWFKKEEDQ